MNTEAEKEQALESFRKEGYVALRGFLNEQEVVELVGNVQRFLREIVPTMPPHHVFYENKDDKSTLKQLQQMFGYDPYFRKMMFGSEFEKWAEHLLQTPVVGKNLQYFNKPPGVGQPTPAHQDGFYMKLEPCEAVTMWLALEDVDEENGCVRYVPGSHRRGMRLHQRTQTLGFSQGISDYGQPEDVKGEIPVPAKAGDLLIHHAMTIHRADGNRSKTRTRQALGFIFYSALAREDEQTIEAYQKTLHRDLAAAGKI